MFWGEAMALTKKINVPYLLEFLRLFGIYSGYIVACPAVLIIIRFTTKVPDYIFRKLLHIVAFTSILPLVLCTDIWWIAAAVEILFLILVLAALHFLEPFSFYKKLFPEKAKHEVIISFVALFGLMTLLIYLLGWLWHRAYLYRRGCDHGLGPW